MKRKLLSITLSEQYKDPEVGVSIIVEKQTPEQLSERILEWLKEVMQEDVS